MKTKFTYATLLAFASLVALTSTPVLAFNPFGESEFAPVFIDFDIKFIEADVDLSSDINEIDFTKTNAIASLKNPKLLAAPRFKSRNGEETRFQSITDYIYPGTFALSNFVTTNDTKGANFVAVEAQNFVMREVGMHFSATPICDVETGTIDLQMSASITYEPVWKNYGGVYTDSSGIERRFDMEQPFFTSNSIHTDFRLRDGSTAVFSGWIREQTETKDDEELVRQRILYIVIKAKITD